MFDKMKQLMEVKRQAEQLQRELEAETLDVQEVRGIKVTINGAQRFLSIDIDKELLLPDQKDGFEKDLLKSMNAAVKKSQNLAAQKMKNMTGLNIPGL